MSKAVIIAVDGTQTVADLTRLKEYQDAVGGYIEGLTLPGGGMVYVNEDGQRLGLPVNPTATRILKSVLRFHRYIVGPVVVVGPTDDDGNVRDVTPLQISKLA